MVRAKRGLAALALMSIAMACEGDAITARYTVSCESLSLEHGASGQAVVRANKDPHPISDTEMREPVEIRSAKVVSIDPPDGLAVSEIAVTSGTAVLHITSTLRHDAAAIPHRVHVSLVVRYGHAEAGLAPAVGEAGAHEIVKDDDVECAVTVDHGGLPPGVFEIPTISAQTTPSPSPEPAAGVAATPTTAPQPSTATAPVATPRAVVTSLPPAATPPPPVATAPAVAALPSAAATSPPPSASVTGLYRTYGTTMSFTRDDCGYSPGAVSVTVAGSADGSSATITVNNTRPPDANARTYTGSIKPDGTFTGTGAGAYQRDFSSSWTGSVNGRITSGALTATEDITMAANSWCTTGQRKMVVQHTPR